MEHTWKDMKDSGDVGHLRGGDTGFLGTGGARLRRQGFEHTFEF